MVDLELWLEALPGFVLPADCFAAVRRADAAPPEAPSRCVPHQVSRLCSGIQAGGPLVVEIFQKVGSIDVGHLRAGMTAETGMKWPGSSLELRIRLAVVDVLAAAAAAAAAAASAEAEAAAWATAAAAADQEARQQWEAANQAEAVAKAVAEAPPVQVSPPPPPPPPATASPAPAIVSRIPPRIQDDKRLYKPIALNNCDQILPYLYLGGVQAASDTESLVQQGIRAVCCCCRELEFPTNEFNKDIEYYRVDVEDMSREPIELYWPEATEFIHSWVSREQPVLVHCRAGVSRSASCVIAYLITYHNMSLHDAFFLVRSRRSIVTPNLGFMEKLGEFEEAKRGTEPSIEINKYMSWYTTPERAAVPDLKPD